jgi:hypothetical protein
MRIIGVGATPKWTAEKKTRPEQRSCLDYFTHASKPQWLFGGGSSSRCRSWSSWVGGWCTNGSSIKPNIESNRYTFNPCHKECNNYSKQS